MLGRDVEHSLAYSSEVKNGWIYASLPPICLHGVKREKLYLLTSSV